MSEKRIVILNDHLMHKIDEHRGRLNRAEFVGSCVEGLLRELEMEIDIERRVPVGKGKRPQAGVAPGPVEYVTKQDFKQFKLNIDKLQQKFMDFFIKYSKQLAGEALSKEEAERFSSELMRLLQL